MLTVSLALSCTVGATGIKSSAERLGNVFVITVQKCVVGAKGILAETKGHIWECNQEARVKVPVGGGDSQNAETRVTFWETTQANRD